MSNQTETYLIDRVLNNNVLVVHSSSKEEFILVGKGIGFGAKRGAWLASSDDRIEKTFSLVAPEHQNNFRQLFSMVPPEVVGVAEEIITYASLELGSPLHEHIHVALPDHIGFALTRLQGGLVIENPFLDEIRTLYPTEWRIATRGARCLEERFHVPIPDEEIGFLTLHVHSATHARGLSETVRVTDSVNLAVKTIEEAMGQEIPKDQLNYARLVIHLRFAIQRLLRGQTITNPLSEAVFDKLPVSYGIAEQAASVLAGRVGIPFPKDEIAYLALHIERLAPLLENPN